MAKKRWTAEEEAAFKAQFDEHTRLIEARIAYHSAKIAEERAAEDARAERRRRLRRLLSLGLLDAT
jgi:hypothetical protein